MKLRISLIILVAILLSLGIGNSAMAKGDINSDNYQAGERKPVHTEANPEPIVAPITPSNGLPYYLMVNRACNTVTVYGLDSEGYYSVPLAAFVCSTGRQGHKTMRGTYTLGTNKYRWRLMNDGTYAQYACGFYKGLMFHSICYNTPNSNALITEEYNLLGEVASLGCVRLQTMDAKWIYENCEPGTYVTVYEDPTNPGPLGKPEKLIPEISAEEANGWDPTDPEPLNPWLPRIAEIINQLRNNS